MSSLKKNLLAVLIMVKNEEKSISVTINSIKDLIKNIIVFDTGSTDNTISIIESICKNNSINLHLKCGTFKSFPESRNESLEFANSLPFEFLLLMDSGDELKFSKTKVELIKVLSCIPNNFNYGTVKQQWLDTYGISDHTDIRLVRNIKSCRYDLSYPVHEQFTDAVTSYIMNLCDIFVLFQDRQKYSESTNSRYKKDIKLLLNAPQNKRNLYFLAQSYMSIDDYENGYKYNKLSLESTGTCVTDEKFTYVRIGYCAMRCKMSKKIIFYYLLKAISCKEPPIDAYIYILRFCIDNNCPKDAIKYVEDVYNLRFPSEITLINYDFYNYTRYHLISIICLLCNEKLDVGLEACKKAINYKNHPDDLKNINFFPQVKK